jgi:hypothetical protein
LQLSKPNRDARFSVRDKAVDGIAAAVVVFEFAEY